MRFPWDAEFHNRAPCSLMLYSHDIPWQHTECIELTGAALPFSVSHTLLPVWDIIILYLSVFS